MSLSEFDVERVLHPVDVIEQVAAFRDWAFERSGDDEITISVQGAWSNYHISFSWMEDFEALHLACAFDLKTSDHRRGELLKLLSIVNERLWVGHFDLWSQEDVVMYRHALLLTGGVEPTEGQVEGMFGAAFETCERYYQAFQFVVWAGKPASEAVESVLFETAGEA